MMAILAVGVLAATPAPAKVVATVVKRFPRLLLPLSAVVYSGVTVLSIACMVGATYQPFLYFRF